MQTFNEWLGSKNEFLDPETQKYLDWRDQFTKKFHVGDYKSSNDRDRNNVFVGRITWVLDELGGGEPEKIWDYIGGVNVAERNYYMLLTRLVARDYPEMLAQWKEDGYETGSGIKG